MGGVVRKRALQLDLVRDVFSHWFCYDEDGAAREALALPDPKLRDAAAYRIASLLVREEYPLSGGSRSDLAEQLFDAIGSADLRRNLAKALHRHYTVTYPDPDKARHYADLAADDVDEG